MKTCKDCGVEKPLSEFYKARSRKSHMSYCKPCQNLRAKAWKENNPEKWAAAQKKSRRKNKYGLTDEDIKIVESIDSCEVCFSKTNLVVDHCHEKTQYRGVLCNNCNTAIGLVKENIGTLEGLVIYLKERK